MATGKKLWLLIRLGKVMGQTCKSSMNTGYCCGRMSSCKLLRLFPIPLNSGDMSNGAPKGASPKRGSTAHSPTAHQKGQYKFI
jgi:hypothetical protein